MAFKNCFHLKQFWELILIEMGSKSCQRSFSRSFPPHMALSTAIWDGCAVWLKSEQTLFQSAALHRIRFGTHWFVPMPYVYSRPVNDWKIEQSNECGFGLWYVLAKSISHWKKIRCTAQILSLTSEMPCVCALLSNQPKLGQWLCSQTFDCLLELPSEVMDRWTAEAWTWTSTLIREVVQLFCTRNRVGQADRKMNINKSDSYFEK